MKKLLHTIFILTLGFGIGFGYHIAKGKISHTRKGKFYQIAKKGHRILENKPFVILTMSYNNAPYVKKNLLSLLEQDYDNFRVLYVDDASTDGTADQVKQFLEQYDQSHRTVVIHNETNRGAAENLYHAVHSCRSDEIVLIVDGDDFLAHSHVLSTLNAYYADPDVWMTYGNFAEYPSYKVGKEREVSDCRPIHLKISEKRGIRRHAFVTSHLRTFYAGLFHRIQLQDLLVQGDFLPVGCDVASMLPMLELAGKHAYFIPEILYLYNTENPSSDFRRDPDRQLAIEKHIRNLPPYAPLSDHPSHPFLEYKPECISANR